MTTPRGTMTTDQADRLEDLARAASRKWAGDPAAQQAGRHRHRKMLPRHQCLRSARIEHESSENLRRPSK